MRPATFCETVGDVETEVLINTMHQSLAEVEAETPGDPVRDVEAEASVDTLSYRLPEVKADKVGETLTDVKGASLV